jgi:hypothetical protein
MSKQGTLDFDIQVFCLRMILGLSNMKPGSIKGSEYKFLPESESDSGTTEKYKHNQSSSIDIHVLL